MKLHGLVVVLASWAVACGDLAPETSTPQGDGGLRDSSSPDDASRKARDAGSSDSAPEADAPPDGGQFACGDAVCEPSQLCVYPICPDECVRDTVPPNDAGLCP